MKMLKTGIGLLGIMLLALLGFWQADLAKAANTGVQISPATYDFEIATGGTQSGTLLITNRNDEAMEYVMELELFENSSEDGVPSFKAVSPKAGVSTFIDWVTFPEGKTGTIPVGESKKVNFIINISDNAEPGGHYGAIFAKQTKPLIQGQTQVGVAARVGALTLISVPGTTTNGATLKEFEAPKFVWQGPVDMKMRVENTGTVHYDSQTTAEIKNLWGSVYKLDMGAHTILPKNIRLFAKTWETKYPFGYYRITPTATDGSGATISGSVVTMIAIPLVIVVPSLVGLLLLIWLIVYLKRHVRLVK